MVSLSSLVNDDANAVVQVRSSPFSALCPGFDQLKIVSTLQDWFQNTSERATGRLVPKPPRKMLFDYAAELEPFPSSRP